jgi:hypothetical protein
MFGSSMGNLLLSVGLSEGIKASKDYFFGDQSFLQITGLQDTAFGRFFDSPAGEFATNVAKKATLGAAEQFFGRDGIGQNPASTSQTGGGSFTPFSSKAISKSSNYNGFPQGAKRILENAFQDSAVQDMAMKYTQARFPEMRVVNPTVRLSTLGALGKGQIKSVKS